MKTQIILLRGINVGSTRSLPMKDLTALLGQAGLQNVKTYIQSGNVVARGKKIPAGKIGALIEQKFGFCPEVMILDEGELAAAMAHNPYQADAGKTIHFYFCAADPRLDTARIETLKTATEQYLVHDRVFYLYAPDGIGKSKLVANIESCLGTKATGRNLNTVNKLREMTRNT